MASGYSHRGKGKKELHHIEIHMGEKGGHVVHHIFNHNGPEWHEPEIHPFGKEEGDAMLAHVANHMGVSMPKGADTAEEMKEDEEGPDEE